MRKISTSGALWRIFCGQAAILVIFFFPSFFAAAQDNSDALAIKIIPNPNHYSALRWYQEQGFRGSPQSIIVDGYAGIRDGRTVYVNAANVVLVPPGALYTNIYLISFNQEAENATVDIFGQLLSHWKFNSNMVETGLCAKPNEAPGARRCLSDDECPEEEYCDSQKARVTRDVFRLGGLSEISIALRQYKQKRGTYPKLSAGSYIQGNSISTWPSWKKLLAQELALDIPIDPVNRLGLCAGYNEVTCWNEQDRRFADINPSNSVLELPLNSKAYMYSAKQNGNSYGLCGVMESGFIGGSSACSGSASFSVNDNSLNNPPQFTYSSLSGLSGEQFFGFIRAVDADGDELSWTIDTSPTSAALWSSWSSRPVLRNNRSSGERIITSPSAGNRGTYRIGISVSDGKSTTTAQFDLNIGLAPVDFDTYSISISASSTRPLNYDIRIDENNPSRFPLQAELEDLMRTGAYDPASTGATPGLWSEFNAGSYYHFVLKGSFDPATQSIPAPYRDYYFRLGVRDNLGTSQNRYFSIRVLNDAPIINGPGNVEMVVGSNALVNNPFVVSISDPQNNNLDIQLANPAGIPPGTTAVMTSNGITISGVPSGPAPHDISYPNAVVARDEYGAETVRPFIFKITNRAPVISNVVNLSIAAGVGNLDHVFGVTDADGHALDNFIVNGLPGGIVQDPINKFRIAGVTNIQAATDKSYPITLTAIDHYGAETVKNFILTITNRPPVIGPLPCDTVARWHNAYSCNISGSVSDPDSHGLSYAIEGADLNINNAGLITGSLNVAPGNKTIIVTVTDQLGAVSMANFNLSVNDYCGDGIRQSVNTERKGGTTDDGREGCDGSDNIATFPAVSSFDMQYACTAGCPTPFGVCANFCIPTGGWCGDGILQGASGESCDPAITGVNIRRSILSGRWGTALVDTLPDAQVNSVYTASCGNNCALAGSCGDGILNGPEVCDRNMGVQPCAVAPPGWPSYCEDIAGTQTCNNDCSGWNTCSVSEPSFYGNTTPTDGASCSALSPAATNYSCCVLTDCLQDYCGCCGRPAGAAIPLNYSGVQALSPCGGTDNSCRMNRSTVNPRNWMITTNHSITKYMCWD